MRVFTSENTTHPHFFFLSLKGGEFLYQKLGVGLVIAFHTQRSSKTLSWRSPHFLKRRTEMRAVVVSLYYFA